VIALLQKKTPLKVLASLEKIRIFGEGKGRGFRKREIFVGKLTRAPPLAPRRTLVILKIWYAKKEKRRNVRVERVGRGKRALL